MILFFLKPPTTFHYDTWFVTVWELVTVTCDIMLNTNARSKIENKFKIK